MATLDITPLVNYLRVRTVVELRALSSKPLRLPEMPPLITTGDRVYETNLRSLLRYLKHVNKACKRQDPDLSPRVLAYRAVVKQFHDVDEWTTKTFVSMDMPKGLKDLAKGGIAPEELRDLLNECTATASNTGKMEVSPVNDGAEVSSRNSPLAIQGEGRQAKNEARHDEHPLDDGISFQFGGSSRASSPDQSPSRVRQFRFRCASYPTLGPIEHATSSQGSHALAQVYPSLLNKEPERRRTSCPVSAKESSDFCFLYLTGETLEEFIAGVEVAEPKITNKKRWLMLLHSFEATWFLGRWPSSTKLHEFMRKHNLEWVVRVRGTWDLAPKTAPERQALKEEVLQRLFAEEGCDSETALVEEVATENNDVDHNIAESASVNATHAEDNAPAQSSIENCPIENIVEEDTTEEQSLGLAPADKVSAFETLVANLNHVFVWQNTEDSTDEPAQSVDEEAVQEDAVFEESSTGCVSHIVISQKLDDSVVDSAEDVAVQEVLAEDPSSSNLSHVFVWQKSADLIEEAVEEVNVEEVAAIEESSSGGLSHYVSQSMEDLTDEPFDNNFVQEAVGVHESSCGNLSHIFVWEKIEDEPNEHVQAEEDDDDEASAGGDLSHVFVWQKADESTQQPQDVSLGDQGETKEYVEDGLPVVEEANTEDVFLDHVRHKDAVHEPLVSNNVVFAEEFSSEDLIESNNTSNKGDLTSEDDQLDEKEVAMRKVSFAEKEDFHDKQRVNWNDHGNSNLEKTTAERTREAELPKEFEYDWDGCEAPSDVSANDKAVLEEGEIQQTPENQANVSIFTEDDDIASLAVETDSVDLEMRSVDDKEDGYTPPQWSITPVLAGVTISALFVSIRCPALTAVMLAGGALWAKSKLNQ